MITRMSWFFIALIGPALFAACNHIDKYLINKYFKGGGAGALLIFSSLLSLLFIPVVFLFQPHLAHIGLADVSLLILGNVILNFSFVLYLQALSKGEAGMVVPLFQIVPIFSFVLAYLFLHETLSTHQILASLLIIAGAVSLSIDLAEKRLQFKLEVFLLMSVASFLIAVSAFIFKFVALQADYWTSIFWGYIGYALAGALLFIFVRKYRVQFWKVLRENKAGVLGANALSEMLYFIGSMIGRYASLLAPLALVQVVGGFQPLFIFLYRIVLTLFFPFLGKESLTRKLLLQKILAISVIIIGSILLFT